MPNCYYYYDEQRNRCNCYVNENLNELLSENAKLREEIEAAKHDLQVFSMSSVQLDADNAKLRELLREMYEDQCCDGDQWKYRGRMSELGVEVN